MGKVLNQVSCLIKAREYNVGFPGRFSHYPENMDSERMDKIHTLVLEAMQDPGSISESGDRVRRIVIGDGKYMVLGISGYLRSIMPDLSDEYNSFCDLSETRRTYGFAGFVWDLTADTELPQDFPEITEFAELFKIEILPHWKDSANSIWAENVQRGILVPYSFEVHCGEDDISKKIGENRINTNKRKVAVFRSTEALLVHEAIFWASKRYDVSLCTDLDYYEESGTDFMNLCSYRCKEERRLYDNIRNDVSRVKRNEQAGSKPDDVRGNSSANTVYVDENTENLNRRNSNREELAEEIRIEIVFYVDRSDRGEAESDRKDLYRLMEEYISSINGKIVSIKNPQNSILGQMFDGWRGGINIIYVINCPSDVDLEEMVNNLTKRIEGERSNGYLCTVELKELTRSINKRCNERTVSETTKGLSRKRTSQNGSHSISDKNDGSIDSVEQFTEQLTELFGNGGGKSSQKNSNTGSNSENPFSL